MIDAVEEFLDVQINHPVLLPAASPARPHRIQRGPLRPVTIGVGMEFWFHSFLQLHGYHCLRNSVRDGRHAEDPHPAMRFRYLHRQHRGREVAPRGHPIPYPVEIVPQIRLEVFDRAPVHARRSLIGFDSLVCLPHEPLRNTEGLLLRLRLAHSIPPRILWLPERTSPGQSGSFAPPPLQELRHYYEPVRMPAPRQYSAPRRFRPLERAPSRRRRSQRPCRGQPSHVPRESRRPGSRRLYAGHRLASNRVPARLILEPRARPSSDAT